MLFHSFTCRHHTLRTRTSHEKSELIGFCETLCVYVYTLNELANIRWTHAYLLTHNQIRFDGQVQRCTREKEIKRACGVL